MSNDLVRGELESSSTLVELPFSGSLFFVCDSLLKRASYLLQRYEQPSIVFYEPLWRLVLRIGKGFRIAETIPGI